MLEIIAGTVAGMAADRVLETSCDSEQGIFFDTLIRYAELFVGEVIFFGNIDQITTAIGFLMMGNAVFRLLESR